MIGVPHLKFESGRYFALCLIPREKRFFFRYHDFFLRHEIVEREQKPPIEVPFTRQWPVVNVRALAVFGTF